MSAAREEKPEIKIKLTVVKGPHEGQVFQINKDIITIGRGPENNIVLMNDPQISRAHAQIAVVNSEVEVLNLSQKNAILVDGMNVQKWKLFNSATFVIGDSEIKIEYDLGQAVVSIPTNRLGDVVSLKTKANVATPPKNVGVARTKQKKISIDEDQSSSGQLPAVRKSSIAKSQSVQQVAMPKAHPPIMGNAGPQVPFEFNANFQVQGQVQNNKNGSLLANPNFKIVLIVLIVLGIAYSYYLAPSKKSQAKKIASTLKYEDEINSRLASKKEKDLEEDREYQVKMKSSPQTLRVNESFIRGMRDYQLGNYTRAQEFFQVVLNLEPDHALAKRHLYLAKVRFDELVQEKLMLGDSYYKKHNFRMCQSMYTQVIHMLEGKNNDQKYLLAEKKAKECNLAFQGIR